MVQPLSTEKVSRGRRCEALAAAHLVQNGYRILKKNLRCEIGEIDLLGEEEATGRMVLFEVRSRVPGRFRPVHALSFAKIKRLRRLAEWVSVREKRSVRIELVEVIDKPDPEIHRYRIESI